ncbi:hypothetical protein CTI12_AA176180 [Artemisia annua]|uniref:HAT C-terminal dimerisation domain-containing protein n=1 Tax=Artemisia annua TaxID=35608 RepID=A0A2U1P992_ARTAN|nr:hypothetical protein CTI12_AA176180 [Artemisia annua]
MYDLVERVCRLLLTLLVLTATTERGFLAMKIFKNRLRNKMSDENLANSMVIYIEKEIADKFDSESIIEEFKGLKANGSQKVSLGQILAYLPLPLCVTVYLTRPFSSLADSFTKNQGNVTKEKNPSVPQRSSEHASPGFLKTNFLLKCFGKLQVPLDVNNMRCCSLLITNYG